MADEHAEKNVPNYDPENVDLPDKQAPLRSTSPQSDFTMGQVSKGAGVAAVGLLLTFGIALLLV